LVPTKKVKPLKRLNDFDVPQVTGLKPGENEKSTTASGVSFSRVLLLWGDKDDARRNVSNLPVLKTLPLRELVNGKIGFPFLKVNNMVQTKLMKQRRAIQQKMFSLPGSKHASESLRSKSHH